MKPCRNGRLGEEAVVLAVMVVMVVLAVVMVVAVVPTQSGWGRGIP